jgi:elongation factor G
VSVAVPYRETVRKMSVVMGRYADVLEHRGVQAGWKVVVEPLPRGGGTAVSIEDPDGVIPPSVAAALNGGVEKALEHGPIAGYPVIDLRATIVADAGSDASDANLVAAASSRALREALDAADPVLLEPIALLAVSVPEGLMDAVIGDLNRRRGRLISADGASGAARIVAETPASETLDLASTLSAFTGGSGVFGVERTWYDELPPGAVRPP